MMVNQKIYQFNLADRVLNARRENQMIEAMKAMKPVAPLTYRAQTGNALKSSNAQRAVLEALTHPMSSADVAAIVDRDVSTIAGRLSRMKDDGLVICVPQESPGKKRPKNLWELTGKGKALAAEKVDGDLTEAQRRTLLALATPMTVRQVIDHLEITHDAGRASVQRLKRLGLIERHSLALIGGKRTAMVWVAKQGAAA